MILAQCFIERDFFLFATDRTSRPTLVSAAHNGNESEQEFVLPEIKRLGGKDDQLFSNVITR